MANGSDSFDDENSMASCFLTPMFFGVLFIVFIGFLATSRPGSLPPVKRMDLAENRRLFRSAALKKSP
jgi:hypothetical protein